MPLRNAKTAEKKVQLLELFLRAGTWTYDVFSREITWSSGMYQLMGLDPKAVSASFDLYESLVHPDDRLTNAELMELARSDRLSVRNFRVIRPDGHLIWLRSTFERQYDREGRLGILHGVVQDITEHQTDSLEYIHTQHVNSSLRRLAGGDFWRAGPQGKLLDLGSWIRFTGRKEEQLLDYDGLVPVHPDDRELFRETWKSGISGKHRIELRVRVCRYDGVYVTFDNEAVPVLDNEGEIIEWHGVSRIVSELKPKYDAATSIASRHIRAARALLDWTAPELSDKSSVSFSTLRRMEVDVSSVKTDQVKKVSRCFGETRHYVYTSI